MYTEDEARERNCPVARERGWNAPRTCEASNCMAWRWRRRYGDEARDAQINHGTGYCGMAGKP